MTMTKKEWASKRNQARFKVSGHLANIEDTLRQYESVLTDEEIMRVKTAKNLIASTSDRWKDQTEVSKEQCTKERSA